MSEKVHLHREENGVHASLWGSCQLGQAHAAPTLSSAQAPRFTLHVSMLCHSSVCFCQFLFSSFCHLITSNRPYKGILICIVSFCSTLRSPYNPPLPCSSMQVALQVLESESLKSRTRHFYHSQLLSQEATIYPGAV